MLMYISNPMLTVSEHSQNKDWHFVRRSME